MLIESHLVNFSEGINVGDCIGKTSRQLSMFIN